ncbi:unnamed protein product [Lathyrus oleraceus]
MNFMEFEPLHLTVGRPKGSFIFRGGRHCVISYKYMSLQIGWEICSNESSSFCRSFEFSAVDVAAVIA